MPQQAAFNFFWPLLTLPLTLHALRMLLRSAEASHDADGISTEKRQGDRRARLAKEDDCMRDTREAVQDWH
jgi:hypothetical protein